MPPPNYPPSDYTFGVRVYTSLEDLFCGGHEEALPPGNYPYTDWGRWNEFQHCHRSDGYYFQLRPGQQEVWQWQHILWACTSMSPDEIDPDWSDEDLPPISPGGPTIHPARGETIDVPGSFRCWGHLRDAQNPERFEESGTCSGKFTVQDRAYYDDVDGDIPLESKDDWCLLLELETSRGKRCWTYQELLMSAMSTKKRRLKSKGRLRFRG